MKSGCARWNELLRARQRVISGRCRKHRWWTLSWRMSSNRELNRQVRDFIKNGEEGSALEALKRGELPCSACSSGYGGFPYALPAVR